MTIITIMMIIDDDSNGICWIIIDDDNLGKEGHRFFLLSRLSTPFFGGVQRNWRRFWFWSQFAIILGWCLLLDTKETLPNTSPPFRIYQMVEMHPRTRWFEFEAWPDVSESQWARLLCSSNRWMTWSARRKDGKLIDRWIWKGPSII
jgi:hypothetical protein